MLNALPAISIIMPIYNVAPYLGDSVQSVLQQTFADFELILIDDGSSDGSGRICDELSLADTRIRVIHQKNRGVAATRNIGISLAKGQYIGFVDGDDWIEPNMYALLYENSLAQDAEISACGFIKVRNRDGIEFVSPIKPIAVLDAEQALRSMLTQNHLRYSACNKLFKRALFENIRYPEGKWIEDKATTYKLLHACQRVIWCPSTLYHYYLRPDSVSHTEFDEKFEHFFEANDDLMRFMVFHYPRLVKLTGVCFAAECLRVLDRLEKSGYQEEWVLDRCLGYIRQNWKAGIMSDTLDVKIKWDLLRTLWQYGFK